MASALKVNLHREKRDLLSDESQRRFPLIKIEYGIEDKNHKCIFLVQIELRCSYYNNALLQEKIYLAFNVLPQSISRWAPN